MSGVPIVGTNDVHYPTIDESEAQDFLSCIGSGKRIDDPDRRTMIDGNYALRPADEMREILAYAPRAADNTLKIADMIDIDIPHGKALLPIYPLNEKEKILLQKYTEKYPDDEKNLTQQEWLLRLNCFLGLNKRYGFTLSE